MWVRCHFNVSSMWVPCEFDVSSMWVQCEFNVSSVWVRCEFHVSSMWVQWEFNVSSMWVRFAFNVTWRSCRFPDGTKKTSDNLGIGDPAVFPMGPKKQVWFGNWRSCRFPDGTKKPSAIWGLELLPFSRWDQKNKCDLEIGDPAVFPMGPKKQVWFWAWRSGRFPDGAKLSPVTDVLREFPEGSIKLPQIMFYRI